MKAYKVTKGPAAFGPGDEMKLSPAQVAVRAHHLDVVKADGKLVHVKANAAVEFKAGEVIWLPKLERRLEQRMASLDGKPAAPAAPPAAPALAKAVEQPIQK